MSRKAKPQAKPTQAQDSAANAVFSASQVTPSYTDDAPNAVITLARLIVVYGAEEDSCIGRLIAETVSAEKPDTVRERIITDFAAELLMQYGNESKRTKAVVKSRKSDLNAVLKAAIAVPAFKDAAQKAVDNGNGRLQGLAALARSMAKKIEQGSSGSGGEGSAEAEGEETPVTDLTQTLLRHLSAAKGCAEELGLSVFASKLSEMIESL